MKIILAAGGSGGHIFPAVALAAELKKRGIKDIFFVSSKRRLDKSILDAQKHRCFFLSVNPLPGGFKPLGFFVFAIKFFVDMVRAGGIVLKIRPDVVVGFGGYSSCAIAVTAWIFKIPVMVHEQNIEPGIANKMLSRLAKRIAISFRGAEGCFGYVKEKIFYSGNPLRMDILFNDRKKSAEKLGIASDKFTVLVIGGSQGASFLNKIASECALVIKERMGDMAQFIHITGRQNDERIREFYRVNKINGKVYAFLENIADAYAASDVAVSRSGAAAIFELAFYGKPMILVPYPNPKNSQKHNAVYFSKNGAALLREEKELDCNGLASDVIKFLNNESYRADMAKAALKLAVPEAGSVLAEEVIKMAKCRAKACLCRCE
ncbi:MAG: undecaprenyldiphospho-muramoylpentapeptide beta-N-acetylglucosaminyltransferase [Candidatus Omnitrophota bacterium]